MHCKSCHSENQKTFDAEINIHFPELKNLDKVVLAFPKLMICMDCGFIEARLSESELSNLAGNSGETKQSVA